MDDIVYINTAQAQQQLYITIIFLAIFLGCRKLYSQIRRNLSQLNLVVIGAGPIGLTSALVAIKSGKIAKAIILEEKGRNELINRSYQVSFDNNLVTFLQSVGVDFDHIEGCWQNGFFHTKVGVYLEYILDVLQLRRSFVEVRFNRKFDKDTYKELDSLPGRLLVIVCDGRNGNASSLLGLGDEYEQHSCGAYGAVAAIDRMDQREVPTPERRIHNLTFDLSAYGTYSSETDGQPGFSMKIFGNSKHRFLSVAILRCESPVVKTLRTILDRSMMRNIFLKCFNTYKEETESTISDSYALNHMRFSPRLFEIKLSQKTESVAYFDDCDMFVTVEGEALFSLNYHTGLDVNPGIRSLRSLTTFINMITLAENEHAIKDALVYKMKHNDKLSKEFIKSRIKETMFS